MYTIRTNLSSIERSFSLSTTIEEPIRIIETVQKLKIAKEVQYFLRSFGKKSKQEKNLSRPEEGEMANKNWRTEIVKLLSRE